MGQDELSSIDHHIQSIKKIESDLRDRINEKKGLIPSGLLAVFQSVRNPERVEELEMEIELLMIELRQRRADLLELRSAMEAKEAAARRADLVPVGIKDAAAASNAIRMFRDLEKALGALDSMAQEASHAAMMQVQAMRSRNYSRHRMPTAASQSVARHTERWEIEGDRAELLADELGISLILPRRVLPAKRTGVQPPVDIATGRAARVQEDFNKAVETSRSLLQQTQNRCLMSVEALKERFPSATEAVSVPPSDPVSMRHESTSAVAPTPEGPREDLPVEAWERLRKLYQALCEMSERRARTVAYLKPVGEWQRQASALASSRVLLEADLVPPVNQGMDMDAFILMLQSKWPALDKRFVALTKGSDPNVMHVQPPSTTP